MTRALRERARAMHERATHEAGRVLDAAGTARVHDALYAALLVRDEEIDDDHDPRCLVPARTIRILVADAQCRDATVLCAAAFVDSVDARLVADRSVLDTAAARLAAAVPLPAEQTDAAEHMDATERLDGDLLERLIVAAPAAALIAVAERLDQARHLHLRPELDWPEFHEGIRRVYVPVAHRSAHRIALRLERWADAFERRLLLPG